MSNSKFLTLIVSIISLSCGKKTFSEDEIFVNRLVYLKSDSTLLSGYIEERENTVLISRYEYKNGIPCGKWESYLSAGELLHSGEYLEKDKLTAKVLELFGTDTFTVDIWKEGTPQNLSINILTGNDFYENDKSEFEQKFEEMARYTVNNFKGIKYDYLMLEFRSNFHYADRFYIKEYEIINGVPVDTEIIRTYP